LSSRSLHFFKRPRASALRFLTRGDDQIQREAGLSQDGIAVHIFGKELAQQGFRARKVGFCGGLRNVEPPSNFGETQLVGIAHPDNSAPLDRQGSDCPLNMLLDFMLLCQLFWQKIRIMYALPVQSLSLH